MKIDEFRERVQQDLDRQVPLRLSVFDYLANNSATFGPFAKDHAISMAATELDEDDKDIFGNPLGLRYVQGERGSDCGSKLQTLDEAIHLS